MDSPKTPAQNIPPSPDAGTPVARAISVTMRAATSWVGFLTAYAAAVATAILAFQKLSESFTGWPLWTRVALASALPITVFVFHTIPTLVDQRRKRRLGEIAGTLQSGYFRLAPREDEASFSRADSKHDEILKWLVGRDKATLLYLTGASGSGKSSLLTAWVLPHLERQETRVIRLRGFQDPLDVLEVELRRPGVIWQKPSTEKVGLMSLVRSASRHIRPTRLLIVLDQFEEFVILQDSERQHQFEQFLSELRKDGGTNEPTLLLVFRSDYIGLIEKLSLPSLAQDANWKEVPPFTERAARDFMRGSGLEVGDGLLRDVLREAAELEQTKGLIRPVTVNLCGLVLGRFASGLPRGFRSGGLIRGFLRESVLLPSVREVSTRLIPHLITNYVTKRPRTITELAQDSGLDPAAVRGCLRVLGQSDRAIVRPLDVNQQTWEVSHDFLVPLLDSIMARWRVSFWRRSRPWLPWIALAMLAVGAIAPSAWRKDSELKDPIIELTDMGWTVTKTDEALQLVSFGGVPPKGSLAVLKRTGSPLFVNLGKIDDTISEWSVLKNLYRLSLTGDKITNLEPLRSLTNLSELDLIGNENITDLEPLKGLTNLSKLRVSGWIYPDAQGRTKRSGSKITNLEPLRGLTNLSELDLSYSTGLSNLEPLRGLTNLSELHLMATNVNNLEPLGGLRSLSALNLSSCQSLKNIEPLKGLTNLSRLYLRDTQVADASIRDLKNSNKKLAIFVK